MNLQRTLAAGVAIAVMITGNDAVAAERQEFLLEIIENRFHPETVRIPANTKIKLIVTNRDDTPEEFESFDLNREKIVPPGESIIIFLPPLKPGEYSFFGEFNQDTAQGKVVAE